jgi:hypothetical protein
VPVLSVGSQPPEMRSQSFPVARSPRHAVRTGRDHSPEDSADSADSAGSEEEAWVTVPDSSADSAQVAAGSVVRAGSSFTLRFDRALLRVTSYRELRSLIHGVSLIQLFTRGARFVTHCPDTLHSERYTVAPGRSRSFDRKEGSQAHMW